MKTLKTYKLTLLLFQILFVIGCGDNSVNSISTNSFYPLAAGNTWRYDYKTYDSLGVIKSVSTLTENLKTTRVKNDSTVYEFDSPLNPRKSGALNETYYFQQKYNGVHYLKSSDPTGYWISDHLLYKYPTSENDIFINTYVYNDTTFVISLNDTITCDAGTFNCIAYKNMYKDFGDSSNIRVIGYSYTYVAIGVGKIKYELFLINSAQQFYKATEYSLMSYTLY